jgi:arsenate reductase-like glutaredoxin family protein
VQTGVTGRESAKKVMLAHASTIKRPVIAWPSGQVTLGFTPDQWPA